MRLNVVLLSVALVALAGCGGGSSSSTSTPAPRTTPVKTLRGPGFKTSVPAGWHERRLHGKGDDIYFSGSSRAPSDLGIALGGIGVTIGVQPASQARNPTSAAVAVKTTVGTPRAASDVVVRKPLSSLRLDRADAATVQFGYRYRDVASVQWSMVALHGGRLNFIEVDAPADLETPAQSVLRRMVRDWRWLRPGTGRGRPTV